MNSEYPGLEAMDRLVAIEDIKRVVLCYARGVDRQDWDLVRGAYHADAFDDHGGYRGGVDGLIDWIRRRHAHIEASMHFVGNCLVDLTGPDTAFAETYCLSIQRYGEAARETIETWLGDEQLPEGQRIMVEVAVRFLDRFERRSGSWRIAHRTTTFEEVKVLKDKSRVSESWTVSKRDRSDPLWGELGRTPQIAA